MRTAAAAAALLAALAATIWLTRERGHTPSDAASRDAGAADARAPGAFDETALMAHVEALAAPEMRGRMAGTEDEARAAAYVRAQLEALGLEVEVREFSYHHADGEPWVAVSEPRTSRNVIAWIEGADDARRDEYVVIGAHYDHLGVDAAGVVYAGADDNASGVAAVLAIAAAWSRREPRPRRSVAFVLFGAEEQGLRGSQAFVDAPPRPLADIALMINLDMVGRSPFMDAAMYSLAKRAAGIAPGAGVGLLGDPKRPDLVATAHAAAAAEGIPLYADSDFSRPVRAAIRVEAERRGDHAPFMDRGVPYVWLSTSMHDDYHRPGDTADKIDASVVRMVAGTAYRIAVAAADASE